MHPPNDHTIRRRGRTKGRTNTHTGPRMKVDTHTRNTRQGRGMQWPTRLPNALGMVSPDVPPTTRVPTRAHLTTPRHTTRHHHQQNSSLPHCLPNLSNTLICSH